MRDRLAEVNGGDANVAATAHAADLESGVSMSKGMNTFFEEVSNVRLTIGNIKKLVQNIEESHGRALMAVTDEEGKDESAGIDALMNQINTASGFVRKKLKDMDAANKAFEAKNQGSADCRIRQSQHSLLVKRFTEIMSEYNEVQNKFQGKYKQKIQKQLLIVKPDATAQEIEQAVSGEGGTAIFAQQIMPGAQYLEARKALEDIQDQRRDIMKIEKSILELQQLFVDMSVLVSQQGELLNQIETHVTNAAEYTGKGVEELKEASKTQKATRKKMCCILICIVIIAVIIGTGVVAIPKK